MANFTYTYGKAALDRGETALHSADIRVKLLMTNTTAGTDDDAQTLDDITTLDEMDGTNYAEKSLAEQAVAIDTVGKRTRFTADDVTWEDLGNGTRQVTGILIYDRRDAGLANQVPLFYIDKDPFNPGGNNFTIEWHEDGIRIHREPS